MFDPVSPDGVKTIQTGETKYLQGIGRTGGAVTNQWWHVAQTATFGEGNLQFRLDRSALDGDLALVLRIDWREDTNIAVQLLDKQGRAVALDLFGEMRHNARAVGTDTFIVPLSRYPQAATVSVRRLSGDLRLLGGGLYPVLSEVAAKAQTEKALAEQLGMIVSPHHWLFTQGNSEGSGSAEAVGDVHTVPSLAKINEIGAAALREPGYPVYKPLTTGKLTPPKISASGTTYSMIINALRTMALRVGGSLPEVAMPSSDGVAYDLLHREAQIGFMSVPLSSAEKEKFFHDKGYPIVELRFARDAIEVIVNASNAVDKVTIPQLDAVYGAQLRAGAPSRIVAWTDLGGSDRTIRVFGGYPGYGTSRVFQQIVLKGGPFIDQMTQEGVAASEGVEDGVAQNADAIGFVTLGHRSLKVRGVAVAANSGEQAYRPDADSIYSGKYPLQRMFYAYVAARSLHQGGAFQRELVNLLLSDVGQTLVARAGSLPLLASEVTKERADLDLPR